MPICSPIGLMVLLLSLLHMQCVDINKIPLSYAFDWDMLTKLPIEIRGTVGSVLAAPGVRATSGTQVGEPSGERPEETSRPCPPNRTESMTRVLVASVK